jgi:metallo-beta-lactamase class B
LKREIKMFKVLEAPWEYYAKPFKIADGLYYVGNKYVSMHLIDTGDGLVLLDTAFPHTLYQLLENIRILGFSPYDIKHIIHTHAHYDHCGATKALVELTGAKTYLNKADIFIIKEKPELVWANEYGIEFCEKFNVDVPFDDGDSIEIGKFKIECCGAPGHTPGTTAFFFDIEERGLWPPLC